MYTPNEHRYDNMPYRRCGKSGLKLPAISLGLWRNFGGENPYSVMEEIVLGAFDLGITYFDLANNYGNPHNGRAEENFGKIYANNLKPHRDEIVVATKAGFEMWAGPYGDRNGSRKYLLASLDQSLKRMGLDYVDIYYHHVPDPETPVYETAMALDTAVRQGKALYAGISNYSRSQADEITAALRELGTPFIVNQISYSMINRWIENDRLDKWAIDNGVGLAVYSPLSQGLLSGKYNKNIPSDSRIGKGDSYLGRQLDEKTIVKLNKLAEIAENRGQSMSQMALSWVLNNPAVATVIIGASRFSQVEENVASIEKLGFSEDENKAIEEALNV
ncbi:MAG: aldo/keto reductase [Oscillospiraceae bacterium]|nr:aldo/keto reductase [Oscillospiraceae bacterium]